MRICSVEMVSGGDEGAWWNEKKEFGKINGQPDWVTLKSECFDVVVKENSEGIFVDVFRQNDLVWTGSFLNDEEEMMGVVDGEAD